VTGAGIILEGHAFTLPAAPYQHVNPRHRLVWRHHRQT